MRYLVSARQELFEKEKPYEEISVARALEILEPMKIVGLDTETEGFDVYTKRLISVQLGNFEHQVMIDCTTIDILLFKEYLESDRLFLLWNAKFDLKFFFHKRICIQNVWDGFLAEKILYLGCLPGQPGLGLKDAADRYLGIELDKSVRGKIHYQGLSDEVIVYACDDVKYLERIRELQIEKLAEKQLMTAVDIENKFVITLAYVEYCGVRLDIPRWKAKMQKDEIRLRKAESELNQWLIDYCEANPDVSSSTVEIIHLTLWDANEGDNWSIDRERLKVKKRKGARRVPTKDISNEEIKTEAWAVPNKNPWILRQIQGDLFAEEQIKARCLINWKSGKQVIPVFEHLGFNLMARDKETGEMKKSVEATVIEPQIDRSPIASIYLEFKAAEKIVSTYGQNFLDQVNPVSHRIHTQFTQLMDTGRLSCGGKNKQTGEKYLNLQNLPKDKETRACFIASEGSDWISIDYSGQESVIIAEVSKDPLMINEFLHGSGDMHSLVAKGAYPEILKDVAVKDIKRLYHEIRNDVKSQVEFPINYGGDWNTIQQHSGKSAEECKRIYDNYMNTFKGVKVYQDTRRKEVMAKGYILLNPLTGHKANIYDYELLMNTKKRFTTEFWDTYRLHKGKENKQVPTPALNQIYEAFANGEDFQSMARTYEWEVKKAKKVERHYYTASEADVIVLPVKHFFRRKSASEKQSINYPMRMGPVEAILQ